MAKGPPGPPKIVEIEKKYSAIEGTTSHSFLYQNDFIFSFPKYPRGC